MAGRWASSAARKVGCQGSGAAGLPAVGVAAMRGGCCCCWSGVCEVACRRSARGRESGRGFWTGVSAANLGGGVEARTRGSGGARARVVGGADPAEVTVRRAPMGIGVSGTTLAAAGCVGSSAGVGSGRPSVSTWMMRPPTCTYLSAIREAPSVPCSRMSPVGANVAAGRNGGGNLLGCRSSVGWWC